MNSYLLTANDKKYGIPEQKKFPLFDADHVRSAIKFFNYVEPRYEKELAKAIMHRAKQYNVDLSEMNIGDNNRFKKYLVHSDELYHSRKGSTWKKHKYISKRNKNGKTVYSYSKIPWSHNQPGRTVSDDVNELSNDINDIDNTINKAFDWLNSTKMAVKFNTTMEKIAEKVTSKVGEWISHFGNKKLS